MKIIYLILVIAVASCSNGNAPGTSGQRLYDDIDTIKVDTVKVEPKEKL